MATGKCPLCGVKKELIQSHIVPEGFYKPLYDGKHRAIHADKKTLDTKWIQKGIREHLLCSDCDNGILGPWDKYAIELWTGAGGMPDTLPGGQIILTGVDYERFKLFHLSVLWRTAACSKTQWGKIDLGPHFERIRQIILSGKAPDENEYPLWGMALLDDRAGNEVCKEMVFYAGHDHRWGLRIYVTVFGGVAWHYVVASHADSRIPHEVFSRAGKLYIEGVSVYKFRPVLERLPAIFAAANHNK